MEKLSLNKVAGYRVMMNMTQQHMADYLKISLQTYNNKERGKRAFTDSEKIKIKLLFQQIHNGLNIDEIFF